MDGRKLQQRRLYTSRLGWSPHRKDKLITGIAQLGARTPASLAMQAMTLDGLSGGRFCLGIGVSGPQVIEGWYGQPFGKPLTRTRETVNILREIWKRENPVVSEGSFFPLPYPREAPHSWGLGKPLKLITQPLRSNIPILLGAEGPRNIALAFELCQGWIPLYFSPERPDIFDISQYVIPPDFEIAVNVNVNICDDVHLTGMAMVTGSINEPGMYSSGTGLLPATEWRKAAVRFRQLDDLAKRVKALEKHLK